MPHTGRGSRQSQSFGNLTVSELLEMPHQYDLAIFFFKLIQRQDEPSFQFFSNTCGSRGQLVIGQLAHQVQSRLIGKLGHNKRLFTIETSPLCPSMPAIHVDHSIFCQLPQPQVKWQPGIGQVVLQSRIRLQQDVLNDVAGIDPPSNPTIQPQLNHFAKRRSMPFEQPVDGGAITCPGTRQQVLCDSMFGPDRHRDRGNSECERSSIHKLLRRCVSRYCIRLDAKLDI